MAPISNICPTHSISCVVFFDLSESIGNLLFPLHLLVQPTNRAGRPIVDTVRREFSHHCLAFLFWILLCEILNVENNYGKHCGSFWNTCCKLFGSIFAVPIFNRFRGGFYHEFHNSVYTFPVPRPRRAKPLPWWALREQCFSVFWPFRNTWEGQPSSHAFFCLSPFGREVEDWIVKTCENWIWERSKNRSTTRFGGS